jgi:pyrimidine-nucleoside phosphorylase
MAAWAMAVLLRGMTVRETVDLTMAMVASGETLDLSPVGRMVVDKHSTGGVGDKTTLIVAPLVAAAGLPVAKMSGRGLGFSGGTLDKLESIPGFQVSLSLDAFFEAVRSSGIVVAGQTAQLVPADGKLYALRDVTATVPSLPLIASSIMSKKLAGGAQAIVLDVKVGHGAFMETEADARELAELMIHIGQGTGRQVTALLSDMSQPLGYAVGNALEVAEAIRTLQGNGPADLTAHCLQVAAEMLLLAGEAETVEQALESLRDHLGSGQALSRFRAWVSAQGGDPRVVEDLTRLPQAPVAMSIAAPRSGYVAAVDAREIALTAVQLGAGRTRKGDPIDPSVGVVLAAKVGDEIEQGDALLTVHAHDRSSAQGACERLLAAYQLSKEPTEPPPLFHDILRPDTTAGESHPAHGGR